jgi:hypothetical protein
MSDMEKDKQAFEMRCVECGESKNLTMLPHRDKCDNMVGVLYACGDCMEIVRGSQCIIDVRRDKEIAALKAEIEELRKNAEYWYNERNKEIKKYQAEIERKDEALNKIANTIWHKSIAYGAAQEFQRMAKQALQGEEESDA